MTIRQQVLIPFYESASDGVRGEKEMRGLQYDEQQLTIEDEPERGILKEDVTAMKSDVKEMRQELSEMRGDIKAISAQISTAQTKIGWYISLLTIGVSVALVLFQYLIK